MDARISTASRPDVVMIESTPRPTPTPARVSFGQIIAAGASSLVQGAELVASKLPGSPLQAAAVRGGATPTALSLANVDGSSVNSTAEGPAAAATTATPSISLGGSSTGTTGTSADSTSSIDASLQQSAQMNLYYLQIQQEVDSQNRSFTTLSNVLKTEHDSAKAAIENVHS